MEHSGNATVSLWYRFLMHSKWNRKGGKQPGGDKAVCVTESVDADVSLYKITFSVSVTVEAQPETLVHSAAGFLLSVQ